MVLFSKKMDENVDKQNLFVYNLFHEHSSY